MARRAVPVERERQRGPAGLRAQLFLAHVMRPAAARLAYAAAHHQHVDDGAVRHVHVIPVIDARADDHHRLALGLVRVLRELARDVDHVGALHARDRFLPRGRVRYIVVVALRDVLAAEALIEAVVRDEEIIDGGHELLAVARGHAAHADVAAQHRLVIGVRIVRVRDVAEVRERHVHHLVVARDERERRHERRTLSVFLAQVPLAEVAALLLAPAEARRAERRRERSVGGIDHDGLPVGIVGLAERVREVGGAQVAIGHVLAVALGERDEA
ncbi:hypothetical protein LMG28688_07260 [Paraburkholderia caffeinitolerans]|uniref:Uncharacterized protein n=1 Tax=Paraburkholderia caffeinitolerans TaxID=1723730 RepID=A0A6J5H0U0_9BURK|nr:hypothetical protein LMG28688_07260 [Paraburkholderia caffeinitolerans]